MPGDIQTGKVKYVIRERTCRSMPRRSGWTWRPMMGIEPPKRPAGRGARPDNGAIDIDGEAWELQMANGRRGYVVVEPQEWDQCPLRELLKPFDQGAGR